MGATKIKSKVEDKMKKDAENAQESCKFIEALLGIYKSCKERTCSEIYVPEFNPLFRIIQKKIKKKDCEIKNIKACKIKKILYYVIKKQ